MAELHSPEYRSAWDRLAAAGWKPDVLSASEIAALGEDPHTKNWVQELRTAAPAPTESRERTLAKQIAGAVKSALAGVKNTVSQFFSAHAREPEVIAVSTGVVLEKLALEINELKQRVAEQGECRFVGPWNGLKAFKRGNQVVQDGSSWTARRNTLNERPGTSGGADAWVLSSKRGADGKDGKDGRDAR